MSRPRKIAPFLSLAVLAGVVSAVRKRWNTATTAAKYGFVAAIGGAVGLVVALVMRAMK